MRKKLRVVVRVLQRITAQFRDASVQPKFQCCYSHKALLWRAEDCHAPDAEDE